MKKHAEKSAKKEPLELARRPGEQFTRVTAYVPATLARDVKVLAASSGRTVSAVVTAALKRAMRRAS